MKHFYLLLLFVFGTTLYAQDFSKEWQKVYELEKEGSYKTLKKTIDNLYSKANKAKNEAEKAKAVLFKMKLENVLEKVNYQKKINRLQQEISKSSGVYKEVYRWYYIKTLMAAYDSKQHSWSRNCPLFFFTKSWIRQPLNSIGKLAIKRECLSLLISSSALCKTNL